MKWCCFCDILWNEMQCYDCTLSGRQIDSILLLVPSNVFPVLPSKPFFFFKVYSYMIFHPPRNIYIYIYINYKERINLCIIFQYWDCKKINLSSWLYHNYIYSDNWNQPFVCMDMQRQQKKKGKKMDKMTITKHLRLLRNARNNCLIVLEVWFDETVSFFCINIVSV